MLILYHKKLFYIKFYSPTDDKIELIHYELNETNNPNNFVELADENTPMEFEL